MLTLIRPALAASLALTAAVLASDSTPTMKAVRIHAFGGAEELKYEDAPRPVAKAGEVLVKVAAAGVNPVDWKIREGMFGRGAFPMTLGFDISGVVESTGEGVAGFKKGDEVYAYLSLMRGGGYAEYAIALPAELALKPRSIDHVHAAGVPVAALTAWQAIVDTANVRPGQAVLIHAGAGGVGHFGVQIAKLKGAKVFATASEANHAFLKELGADEVIDYRTQKFEEIAKEVDFVLDSIGGDTIARSYPIVKKGGHIVSIVGAADGAKGKELGINAINLLVQPSGKQLAELAQLIDEGRIKPHVSDTFPLTEAAKAHEKSQSGRTRGKIVLKVGG